MARWQHFSQRSYELSNPFQVYQMKCRSTIFVGLQLLEIFSTIFLIILALFARCVSALCDVYFSLLYVFSYYYCV